MDQNLTAVCQGERKVVTGKEEVNKLASESQWSVFHIDYKTLKAGPLLGQGQLATQPHSCIP